MNTDRLIRAAELVAAAHERYLNRLEHHATCVRSADTRAPCDCGADELAEALSLLGAILPRGWSPTRDELRAALDTLDDAVREGR